MLYVSLFYNFVKKYIMRQYFSFSLNLVIIKLLAFFYPTPPSSSIKFFLISYLVVDSQISVKSEIRRFCCFVKNFLYETMILPQQLTWSAWMRFADSCPVFLYHSDFPQDLPVWVPRLSFKCLSFTIVLWTSVYQVDVKCANTICRVCLLSTHTAVTISVKHHFLMRRMNLHSL